MNLVEVLQQQLRSEGFYTVRVTGRYDQETHEIITRIINDLIDMRQDCFCDDIDLAGYKEALDKEVKKAVEKDAKDSGDIVTVRCDPCSYIGSDAPPHVCRPQPKPRHLKVVEEQSE